MDTSSPSWESAASEGALLAGNLLSPWWWHALLGVGLGFSGGVARRHSASFTFVPLATSSIHEIGSG
jgi:hypothetical protein